MKRSQLLLFFDILNIFHQKLFWLNVPLRMKSIVLNVSFLFFISQLHAQAPSMAWGKQFGGLGEDGINSVAVDPYGNIYFVGTYKDSIVIETVKGPVKLVSKYNEDFFIAKMDSNGQTKWVKALKGRGSKAAIAIALDVENNIILSGYFTSRTDFDMGPDSFFLEATMHNELFFLKIDPEGVFKWAFKLDSRSFKNCNALTTDKEGNIYATGDFHLWVDFNPGIGTYWLSSAVHNRDMIYDLFVLKLNKSGQLVWVKQARTDKYMQGNDIELDRNGNIYVVGSYTGTTQFSDDTMGIIKTSSGIENGDIFVAKYDQAGNFIWVKAINGKGLDGANSIAVDNDGNVVTIGEFYGSIDIDPGLKATMIGGKGITDAFLQKLNSNGELIWGSSIGGPSFDEGNNVFINRSGTYTLVGNFEQSIDADPGPEVLKLGRVDGRHGFVQQLDQFGKLLWALEIQDVFQLKGTAGLGGQMFIYGSFYKEIDADPGKRLLNMTSNGARDFFIIKLNAPGN